MARGKSRSRRSGDASLCPMGFWDVLFPPQSLSGADGTWLTAEEWKAFDGHPERVTGGALGCAFLHSVAGGERYGRAPLVRAALTRLKYRRARVYLAPLAALLARAVTLVPRTPETVLCPVPLHWMRRLQRGFNQSEELARAVEPSCGLCAVQLLRRARATGWQSHRISPEERRSAMHGAFSCLRRHRELPSHVILIDDVCTSGATLDACAAALRQGGVQRVDAAVVALG